MRGIEGALHILGEVEKGAFASEALRKVWSDIEPTERNLAATLAYLTERRLGLWRHLLAKYCKRPTDSLRPETVRVLTMGIAGVLELEHFKPGVLVNALVQKVKTLKGRDDQTREAALVNAVLHTIIEKAPKYVEELRSSTALRDQALALGVPGWVAAQWSKDWDMKDAKQLLQLTTAQTYLSVRLSPHVDRVEWIAACGEQAATSEISPLAVRIESNPYPPQLPGYASGEITPQGESSIWAVEELLAQWKGERLLDMCMGRGIKAGHVLSYRENARVTGWDLSQSRLNAAQKEFERLGVSERATTSTGDALTMEPPEQPEAILLDAPCTGSGTWGRHPEGKWRASPEKLRRAAELQRGLFARAADILKPGGTLMYCTCSLFREENENVVGSVLSARQDLVEIPPRTKNAAIRRGKPYGAIMLPGSPWMDGFYIAIFRKKG